MYAGIGTTDPVQKLHVNGDANINNIQIKQWVTANNNNNQDEESQEGPSGGNF